MVKPNPREIELWHSCSQSLGFEKLAEQGVLPRESLPLGSIIGRLRTVEQKKLDVSDPAVREKFEPLK